MKMHIIMTESATTKLADRIIDTAKSSNLCGGKVHDEFAGSIREAEYAWYDDELIINEFAGGRYEVGREHLTLEINDEALIDSVEFAINILGACRPIYDMAKAAIATVKGIGGHLKRMGDDFCDKFKKKYGRQEKFATVIVENDILNLYGVITVEDDGFDHIHLVESTVCGKENFEATTLMKLFWNKVNCGEEIKWKEIDHEEATRIHHSIWMDFRSDLFEKYNETVGIVCDDADTDDDSLEENVNDGDIPVADNHIALVIAKLRPYRGAISDGRLGIVVDNIGQIVKIETLVNPSYKKVDMDKLEHLVSLMIKDGRITFAYDDAEDAIGDLTLMSNDGTYYETDISSKMKEKVTFVDVSKAYGDETEEG